MAKIAAKANHGVISKYLDPNMLVKLFKTLLHPIIDISSYIKINIYVGPMQSHSVGLR